MAELYLSRLTLPLRSRDTVRLLGDCHAMHRLVMGGFPDVDTEQARNALAVLYRVEERRAHRDVQVLVQSRSAPRWEFEGPGIAVEGPRGLQGFLARIAPGAAFRFRLRANPTRRVHARSAAGPEARGKPGAVGKRVAVRDEHERLAWLARKAASGGFVLKAADVAPGPDSPYEAYEGFQMARVNPSADLGGRAPGRSAGGSRPANRLTLETCLFEGVLEVTDPEALRAAVTSGVGPGKAFGCGLLSLAPIPSI